MAMEYAFIEFGTGNTSTGPVLIHSGPCYLHTVSVTSTGTGTVMFYNATSSSTGNEIAVFTTAAVGSFRLDATCGTALLRGATTSTAEVVVTWG